MTLRLCRADLASTTTICSSLRVIPNARHVSYHHPYYVPDETILCTGAAAPAA